MNLFDTEANFNIIYNDNPVRIEKTEAGKSVMYIVRFPDSAPLIITRAKDADGVGFWTSVPEGKQKLAEAIGELIADHIKKNL